MDTGVRCTANNDWTATNISIGSAMYLFVNGAAYSLPDGGVELTESQYHWALRHPGATLAEVLAMELALPQKSFDDVKQERLQDLYVWYRWMVDQGFMPTDVDGVPYGWSLKLTDEALDLWNKDLNRASSALQLGDVESGDVEYFYDATGAVQSLPVAEYARVLSRLGKYFKTQVWAVTEAVKSEIAAATTEEELNQIDIPAIG